SAGNGRERRRHADGGLYRRHRRGAARRLAFAAVGHPCRGRGASENLLRDGALRRGFPQLSRPLCACCRRGAGRGMSMTMSDTLAFSREELLICTIARLLEGCRIVATGASSPIPGSAALLARAQSNGALRVNVLGSVRNDFLCDGGVELFDLAAQGRLDAFFLGGGQIDGEAYINLVGAGGAYPQTDVRWPGSFGSGYLYYLVPRVILSREEHTRRVMVQKVDFISAAGPRNDGTYRPGGPIGLLTNLCWFSWQNEK